MILIYLCQKYKNKLFKYIFRWKILLKNILYHNTVHSLRGYLTQLLPMLLGVFWRCFWVEKILNWLFLVFFNVFILKNYFNIFLNKILF
jgi:hypothetical protein